MVGGDGSGTDRGSLYSFPGVINYPGNVSAHTQ